MQSGARNTSELVTRVAAVLLCGIAVAALIAVLNDSHPENSISKATSAATMLVLFSPIGLAGIALSVRRPPLAWFGYATALIAFVAFIVLTKEWWDGNSLFLGGGDWELPAIALVAALACGQVSLLLAWARSGTLVLALGYGAAAVIVAIGALVVLEILADIEISDRIYGVLAILYLLPVALLPLFTLGRGDRDGP